MVSCGSSLVTETNYCLNLRLNYEQTGNKIVDNMISTSLGIARSAEQIAEWIRSLRRESGGRLITGRGPRRGTSKEGR